MAGVHISALWLCVHLLDLSLLRSFPPAHSSCRLPRPLACRPYPGNHDRGGRLSVERAADGVAYTGRVTDGSSVAHAGSHVNGHSDSDTSPPDTDKYARSSHAYADRHTSTSDGDALWRTTDSPAGRIRQHADGLPPELWRARAAHWRGGGLSVRLEGRGPNHQRSVLDRTAGWSDPSGLSGAI